MERRSPGERGTSGSSAKVSSGTELGGRSSGNQLFKNLTCLKKNRTWLILIFLLNFKK
jgi:hypothetical protein